MKYIYACCILWMMTAQPLWAIDSTAHIINDIPKLETNLQIGSYKGWDLYLNSYVETDSSGFGFYQMAPRIIKEIHNDNVPVKQPNRALENFSSFLINLFSETVIEKSTRLPNHQLTELFNLAYDVNFSKLDAARLESQSVESVASLLSMNAHLASVSKRIEGFYISQINCPVRLQWERVINKPILSIKLVVIEEFDEDSDIDFLGCFNRIDSRSAQTEMLWINDIKISQSSDNSMQGVAASARKILARELKEKTNYNPMGVNGFSEGVLVLLADKVTKLYYKSGGGQLNNEQSRMLSKHLTELYRTRGITFNRLGEIADKLKAYYRDQGFIMSTVYVPQQDFSKTNGTVYLSAQSGVLGKVKLNSASGLVYSDEVISGIFKSYLGRGVKADISDTYFKLGLLPGLSVKSGFFEVGDNPGETNLIVDVDKSWGNVSLVTDNYGSKLTGENRALTSVDWHNPLGYGDSLTIGYLHGFNPDNTQLGYFNYQFPIVLPSTYLGLSYEQNIYSALKDLGGNTPVIVEGESENAGVSIKQYLVTNKDINVRLDLQANKKSALVNSEFRIEPKPKIVERKEISEVFSLGLHMDFLMNSIKTAALIDTQGAWGKVSDADEVNLDQEFVKISTSINTSTLLVLSRRLKSKLSFYVAGSYSDKSLPSYEQFGIGGPDKVKAFTSSVFLGDSGLYGNIELTSDLFNLLSSRSSAGIHKLDVGLFYEKATARLNGFSSATPISAEVSGYGGLIRYYWRRNLVIDSSLSFVDKKFSEDDYQFLENGEYGKGLINVRYTF